MSAGDESGTTMMRNFLNWLMFSGRAAFGRSANEAADRLIAEGNRAEGAGKVREACKRYRKAVRAAPGYAKAHLNLGIGLEAAGDTDGAVKSYDAALAIDPGDAYANYNLANLFYQRGELARAEQLLRVALERKPEFPEAHLALSNVHDSRGDLAAAASAVEVALKQRPDYAGAWHNYGVVLSKLGRLAEAETALRRATELDPTFLPAHSFLGNMLAQQGQATEAIACYRRALLLAPESAAIHYNLGNLLVDEDRPAEAIASYRKALELAPDFPEAHCNLGNVLRDQGGFEESIACYRRALDIKPDFPGAHFQFGNALREQGRSDEAIACYREALRLKPDFLEAHYNLGVALREQNRHDEATVCLETVLGLRPDSAEAHCCLGHVFRDADRCEEALHRFQKALSLNPDYAEARWSLAMSQLPAVYTADADPVRTRTAFSLELDKLDRWFDAAHVAKGSRVVGNQTPFFLAYQEENNRDLLQRYGRLCTRLMAEWFERQALPASSERSSTGAIRVGIVSQFFSNHSVWNAIVKGWFKQLDRGRLALQAYYLGIRQDQETLFAMSHASHFERGVKTLRQWVDAIKREQPEVLIYPEIGMDTMTVRLASLRLAPVQVVAWGHPETTGLPTIDYYLSAEDLEPAGAQSHYTERLVALPHLGCYYVPREVTPVNPDLDSWGIAPDSALILCPGVPFKYAPQYDWVLAEIARRLGQCRFIFFTHRTPNLSEKLRKRLKLVFARKRLDMEDFVTFIPWQNGPEFYGLMKRARVFLDTIGFSGYNTAMQAVECGLPIVAREGRFLRGRLASGIVKRLGLSELVARTEEDYVALAVKLVQDADYREHVRERIEASRHVLFEDMAPIRALEEFLVTATGLR